MWWILATMVPAALAAMELRRVLRERAADAGPLRYALYAADRPDRALLIVEVDSDRSPVVDPFPAGWASWVATEALDRRAPSRSPAAVSGNSGAFALRERRLSPTSGADRR